MRCVPAQRSRAQIRLAQLEVGGDGCPCAVVAVGALVRVAGARVTQGCTAAHAGLVDRLRDVELGSVSDTGGIRTGAASCDGPFVPVEELIGLGVMRRHVTGQLDTPTSTGSRTVWVVAAASGVLLQPDSPAAPARPAATVVPLPCRGHRSPNRSGTPPKAPRIEATRSTPKAP